MKRIEDDKNYAEYRRQIGYRYGIGTPPESTREYLVHDDDLGIVTVREKDIARFSVEPSWAGPLRPSLTVWLKDGTIYHQGCHPPTAQYPLANQKT